MQSTYVQPRRVATMAEYKTVVDMQQGQFMAWVQGVTSKHHSGRLWWSHSCCMQVPSAEPTALWLIVSSPCPALTVLKISSHLMHPRSLSLRWWFMTIQLMRRAGLKVSLFASSINDPKSSCLSYIIDRNDFYTFKSDCKSCCLWPSASSKFFINVSLPRLESE